MPETSKHRDGTVWLAVPSNDSSLDVNDAYTTKIGGRPILLRVPSEEEAAIGGKVCPAAFSCTKCKSPDHVSLLAQLYAPLELYDRVLYICMCSACGTFPRSGGNTAPAQAARPHAAPAQNARARSATASVDASVHRKGIDRTSFCFAVRCQNFSTEYYAWHVAEQERQKQKTASVQVAAAKANEQLFAETDEWGDVANDWGSEADAADAEESLAAPAVASSESYSVSKADGVDGTPPVLLEAFPLAEPGTGIPALRTSPYTGGVPLDLLEEPQEPTEDFSTAEKQLQDAEERYGPVVEKDVASPDEKDFETPMEKVVRKYMDRVGLKPQQCVRWCPGGEPLRATLTPPAVTGVPACPLCGSPRRYECQLTAQTVHFLTKHMGEMKNSALHFSNVFVYTCSANCYSKEHAYVAEVAIAEDEI